MHRAQRPGRALAVDDDGNIAFGSPLGNRPHADRGGPERIEHFRSDTVCAGHAIADNRQNTHAERHFHMLNLAVAQFGVERPAHRLLGVRGLRFRNREANGVLRAALRNQDD
jgi:hypothetical protein